MMPLTKDGDRVAAVLTIHDAPAHAPALAQWLREKADQLEADAGNYAARFRARYLLPKVE